MNDFWHGFEKCAKIDKVWKTTHSTLKGSMADKLLKEQVRRGFDSLSLGGLSFLGKKIFGKKKTYKAMKKIHRVATKADMFLGKYPHKLSKKLKMPNLFVEKEIVPIGAGVHKEFRRTSLMAPAGKASGFVIPMAGMYKIDEMLRKARKIRNERKGTI